MNYPKIALKLKKEFPDLTEEEISQMISQIPPNLPYPLVVMSIKLAKACVKDPKKLDDLKKVNVKQEAQKLIDEQNNAPEGE